MRYFVTHKLINVMIEARKNAKGAVLVTGVNFMFNRGRRLPVRNDPVIAKYGRAIREYLKGKKVDFGSFPLDLHDIGPFRKRVLLAARTIPYGKTVTYSQLASLAGSPGAARAAASVMRNNPFPILVPCHRVVRAGGDIGGFMGKQGGREVELKRKLLAIEKKSVRA